MSLETCKVVGAGLAALGICKFNVLAYVSPADIKLFLEIGVLTVTIIYTGAKACTVLWALWSAWTNRNKGKHQ